MPLYLPATATAPTAHAASHADGGSDEVSVALVQVSDAGTMAAEDSADYAPIVSPTFTGTPAVPTAAADTSTTQVASTAFVLGQSGATSPVVDGVAAAGAATRWSRADHVHPTDTSRAPAVEAVNMVAASGAAETLPDPATYGVSDVTLDQSCTFTLPTVSGAGESLSFMVVLEQGGAGSCVPTFTGATWPYAVVPAWSTAVGAVDQVMFSSSNGRAWVGTALIGVAAP